MEKSRINQISDDITEYQKAIERAENALAEAEREINELLAEYDNGVIEAP